MSDLVDNSDRILREFDRKIALACELIGVEAERNAKEDCPVDTGRLRNSITFATKNYHSPGNTDKHPKGQQDADPDEYRKLAEPEEKTVYIGTNVKYAPPVELRDVNHKSGKAHFLRDAVANHGKKYEEIAKTALKS